ncbi:hypothetical protein [Actinoplanes sichuanensis]|uniref:Integrase n=1 Tax=Actinoplanes sichuanensis TaxID=512349 RepID=A0ABW4A253_9ACTN|nr:hypothetical protein [Actinoplanes sichuanensis]
MRPKSFDPTGLVVRHYNSAGRVREYDFATLPVAEPMQRSLAVLFAARCVAHTWSVHASSSLYWRQIQAFAVFVSGRLRAPRDLDEVTAGLIEAWHDAVVTEDGGFTLFTFVTRLLRDDVRLQSGPVADALARRLPRLRSRTQSFSEAEFDQITAAARREFRSALARIERNAAHLHRWRSGDFTIGGEEWLLGQALDVEARTGYALSGHPGTGRAGPAGRTAVPAWDRLFLSRLEATALGVLLLAQFGWNLSVIDQAVVPRASPDPGLDGQPTYRIPVQKRREGAGRYFETRNVTDDGAGTPGRLITQALAATRFARAIVADLSPGTELLIVWRTQMVGRERSDNDRHPPVGLLRFGIHRDAGKDWAQAHGLGGSPFRRGRRTVNAVERREPGQNSRDTHDRHYALVDKRVQADAVSVIAAGAKAATALARRTVAAAVRAAPDPHAATTATVDCADFTNSPYSSAGSGCTASFLMCLGCSNARIHPGHHSRLAHLHEALGNLRSVLDPRSWEVEWGDAYARLDHLQTVLGGQTWAAARTRVSDADRDLIADLLNGDLNT